MVPRSRLDLEDDIRREVTTRPNGEGGHPSRVIGQVHLPSPKIDRVVEGDAHPPPSGLDDLGGASGRRWNTLISCGVQGRLQGQGDPRGILEAHIEPVFPASVEGVYGDEVLAGPQGDRQLVLEAPQGTASVV